MNKLIYTKSGGGRRKRRGGYCCGQLLGQLVSKWVLPPCQPNRDNVNRTLTMSTAQERCQPNRNNVNQTGTMSTEQGRCQPNRNDVNRTGTMSTVNRTRTMSTEKQPNRNDVNRTGTMSTAGVGDEGFFIACEEAGTMFDHSTIHGQPTATSFGQACTRV